MAMHSYDPNVAEVEAGRSLWLVGQTVQAQ